MPALTPPFLYARSWFDDEVKKADREFNRTGAIIGGCFGAFFILSVSFFVVLVILGRKRQQRNLQVIEDVRLRNAEAGFTGHSNANAGFTSNNNAFYVPPPVYSTNGYSSDAAPVYAPPPVHVAAPSAAQSSDGHADQKN